MFTGLVQAVGDVRELTPTAAGKRLVVAAPGWDHRPDPGDSIAVSGVCLTVADLSPADDERTVRLAFDVVAETLAKSSLGSLAVGSRVNLEHAVRADTLMGGHFVQGHADGVGTVARVRRDEDDWRLTVAVPGPLMAYMVPKGSVSIDGVSLTLAEVGDADVTVALIPTTLNHTTLRGLGEGDPVNLEADMLAKTVVNWLERAGPEALRRAGLGPTASG